MLIWFTFGDGFRIPSLRAGSPDSSEAFDLDKFAGIGSRVDSLVKDPMSF